MNWALLFFVPFVVQIVVISFDEFYFHIKRGLPLWERVGHPVDTFSLVLCVSFVLIFPYSKSLVPYFVALAATSCLLVTKDEFVHKEHCAASEQWLHALLFINHPLVLISMAWMWGQGEPYLPFLATQVSLASLFCIYQIIYWNVLWKEK